MKFYMLQVTQTAQTVEKAGTQLLQYGVLGIFALLMIAVIWYLEKQRSKKEDEQKQDKMLLQERIVKLETKMEDLQEDTIKKLESIVIENSKVLSRNADIMDEVKELLIRRQ